ncbi:MAG: ABC transporter ATP-binding protein [Bacteroidia bacterium]|nr:ABC transporter ATP-binding protein [Bacteroidia bacterium]
MSPEKQTYTNGKSISRTFSSFLEYLSPAHKKQCAGLSVLIVLSAILDVAGLALLLPMVQLAADPQSVYTNEYLNAVYTFFNFSDSKQFLLFFILTVLGFFILKNLLGLFVNYLQILLTRNIAIKITKQQFDKYYRLGYHKFTSLKSSKILHHVLNTPNYYVQWVLTPSIMLFSELCIVLLIIGGIAAYNITLFAFILLTVGPATFLIYLALGNVNKKIGDELDKIYPLSLSTLTSAIMGYIDVKLINKEEHYKKLFMKHQDRFLDLTMRHFLLNMVPIRSYEVVAILGIVVIFIYANFVSQNPGEVLILLGMFAAAAYRMMPSLNRIINSLMYMKKNQVAIDNLNLFKNEAPDQIDDELQEEITFTKDIKIDRLSYTFPETTDKVLSDISFELKRGEKIGIVGASGSGKTTLMNILLRFFHEQEGSILIDDKVLTEKHVRSWRDKLGYVKQDIFLLDGSIRDNIAFGEKVIDEKLLANSVKHASLTGFVNNLPDGLDTEIGEKGSKISGGQRQRLGIARALYKNADILLFDEATSALDNETEKEVSAAIDGLSDTDKTIIIIAHRITTLKNCDRIYELKDGRIVGVYKYEDLIAKVI